MDGKMYAYGVFSKTGKLIEVFMAEKDAVKNYLDGEVVKKVEITVS